MQSIRKGNALILATFNIDPAKLSDEEWVKKKTEAEWLRKYDSHQVASLLAQILGAKKQ